MRVLVTGADGFIGSHLVRGLAALGHDVIGAVFGRVARGREVRVDLSHEEQLVALPSDVQAVVNAAGVVDPRAGNAAMFAANLGAVQNLLAWARARAVGHFVQVSSVAVYGPLVLGEERDEDTPRLGLALGLPYMRSKARAERAIERGGVPYTLLRPPAVLGAGDTVITRGFVEALSGAGLPLVPGAREDRRVSLCLVDGLVSRVAGALQRGPLGRPIHAVDAELALSELGVLYARALGRTCVYAGATWGDVLRRRADAGFSWLVASARFGQHYSTRRLVAALGPPPALSLEAEIQRAVSSLQGQGPSLS